VQRYGAHDHQDDRARARTGGARASEFPELGRTGLNLSILIGKPFVLLNVFANVRDTDVNRNGSKSSKSWQWTAKSPGANCSVRPTFPPPVRPPTYQHARLAVAPACSSPLPVEILPVQSDGAFMRHALALKAISPVALLVRQHAGKGQG
jgi:hypothetical protein